MALMRPVVQSSGSAADHSVHFEPSSPIAAVEYRLVERMKNDSGISRTVDHRSGASIARCVLICSTLSAILSLDETHTVEHCPTNCDVDLSVGVVRSVGARLYYVGQATTGQSDVSPSSSVFSIPGGFQKQKQQDDNAPREPAHGGMGNLTGLSISLPSEAEAGAGNSVSWAQFLDSAGQVVGRIAPNSRGQATFHSGGADFAEWHRRASGEVLPLQTCVLPLLLVTMTISAPKRSLPPHDDLPCGRPPLRQGQWLALVLTAKFAEPLQLRPWLGSFPGRPPSRVTTLQDHAKSKIGILLHTPGVSQSRCVGPGRVAGGCALQGAMMEQQLLNRQASSAARDIAQSLG
eukprot:SAG31_NODE_1266_length_9065_cov_44.433939_5_plen_348_part_00